MAVYTNKHYRFDSAAMTVEAQGRGFLASPAGNGRVMVSAFDAALAMAQDAVGYHEGRGLCPWIIKSMEQAQYRRVLEYSTDGLKCMAAARRRKEWAIGSVPAPRPWVDACKPLMATRDTGAGKTIEEIDGEYHKAADDAL